MGTVSQEWRAVRLVVVYVELNLSPFVFRRIAIDFAFSNPDAIIRV